MKTLLLFLLILGALSHIITLTVNEDISKEIEPKENWMKIAYGVWLTLQIIAIILVFKNL